MIEIIIRITLVLHLVGLVGLLGGFFYQMGALKSGTAKVLPAMLHSAWLLLITGFALTGLVYANGEEVNNLTLALKGSVITAIFFIAYAYAKKDKTPKWVVPVLGLLTFLNVCFAVISGMIAE
ncbi:MAG: hypothetical protein RL670_431 [Actinomycetota bacterium]|jgi:cellobiose-specific phosphotransferase system component IIC